MKNSKVVYFFTGVYRLICPVVALFATTAAKQQTRNTWRFKKKKLLVNMMSFFSKWKNCNAALQFCVTMAYYPVSNPKLQQLVAVFDGASLHSYPNSMALSFCFKDSKEFNKPNSDWIPLATLFNHCRGYRPHLNPPNPRTTGAILNWTAPRLEREFQNAARFSGFFSLSFPNNPDFKPLEFDGFKNESVANSFSSPNLEYCKRFYLFYQMPIGQQPVDWLKFCQMN